MMPMLTTALACLLPFLGLLDAPAAPVASAGVTLSSVEVAGLAGSYFLDRSVSIDGRLTLVSVDAGLSAHLPFSGPAHAVVLTGLGGFRHALVHNDGYLHNVHGGRLSALVGYGYLGTFDLRAQAGLVTERTHPHLGKWNAAFVFAVYAGKTF
jgi:hypothetical protein